MSDDIEALKTHKIEVPPDRKSLPTLGLSGAMPAPMTEAEEAYGGSGQVPEEPIDVDAVRAAVEDTIRSIYDPEIPVNIFDLGLIYGIDVAADGKVEIRMTLTAPACPVSGVLVDEVAQKTGAVSGVSTSHVVLVWDPPWTKERMTEEAQLELGLL